MEHERFLQFARDFNLLSKYFRLLTSYFFRPTSVVVQPALPDCHYSRVARKRLKSMRVKRFLRIIFLLIGIMKPIRERVAWWEPRGCPNVVRILLRKPDGIH